MTIQNMYARVPLALLGIACWPAAAQETVGNSATVLAEQATQDTASKQLRTNTSDVLNGAQGINLLSTVSPSLNGNGIISLEGAGQSKVTLGYTLNGGWDSRPEETKGAPSSALFFANFYLAANGRVGATQYLLQYAPTFTKYTSGRYPGGVFHVASVKLFGALSERWFWSSEAGLTYGKDALRLLTPSNTSAVGDVTAVNPNASTFRLQAGSGLFIALTAHLTYRTSETGTVQFQASDLHSHLSGLNDDDFGTVRFSYTRRLSPGLGLGSYAQVLIDSASPDCVNSGAGISVDIKTSEFTEFSVSGGPQLQSGGCSGRGAFGNVFFSSKVSASTQIYGVLSRQFTSSYLGPASWQDKFGAGLERNIADFGFVGTDVTYTHNEKTSLLPDYHGMFLSATYGRRAAHGLSPSFSYRHLLNSVAGVGWNRDVALFSLTWQSNAISLSR